MKVLASWLREFCSPEVDNKQLAHTLTMSGLEVDAVEKVVPYFDNVVVGEVLECNRHPDADKLNLCKVNLGDEEVQIICGATNVRAGIKVPVARVGATLPGNFKIKKAKLRGIESNGMICSESEIGLTDNSEGIMELDNKAPIGKDVRVYLNLDDEIIDIDITPNRGDCFSILGVAREVAVNYSLELKDKHITDLKDNYATKAISIKASVNNPKYCPKYLIRVIDGIDNTKETPKWIKDKLNHSGFPTHSAVVDITNYVLLELGQPMHSFDATKIDGDINVRLAKQGEKILMLNDNQSELNDDTLVIADNKKPLAIAGIMGGLDSSTTTDTTSIVLESAFFDNILIAGKARSYGLHTESSLRFERGVDYQITELALNYATKLILDICGGNASEIESKVATKYLPEVNSITIPYAKINKVLGFEMKPEWVIDKFKQLGFIVIKNDTSEVSIKNPSYRFDIKNQADLIEELARIYGYDKLPTKNPNLHTSLKANDFNKYDLANKLIASGYNEVINYSFIDPELAAIFGGDIKLVNPISADLQIMRNSLIAGLVKTALHNKKYGQNNLKIFEMGLCFFGENSQQQIEKIAALITGNTNYNYLDKEQEFDFYHLKADLQSIIPDAKFVISDNEILQEGQRADIIFRGQNIGFIGAINPQIAKNIGINKSFVFEVNLNTILFKNKIKYQYFSNYQASKRDVSVLINKKYSYDLIVKEINKSAVKYLTSINLVDIWSNNIMSNDEHSITFSFSFKSNDKTLTDQEIDESVNNILQVLINKFSAIQR